jgi:virulence factor Mce-like protein
MRRLAAIALSLAGLAAVLLTTGASNDSGDYKVRAIFDNAVSVINGEDVKVAGVKVGKIDSLDVTADQKAAVVLSITDAGFRNFRRDAHCTIRPQSLIGEKFVECEPTQPRPEGAQPQPLLGKIPKGKPGAGQYLLPLRNTSTPVDIDLIQNILRRPFRERFSILLNELGTGLAGRSEDLRQVIRRANPALEETDKVLKILGNQNRVLEDLARNSDTVLAPLARERTHISGFVDKAGVTAEATAERRADLERNLQKLPGFLRELRPTAERLKGFADQAGPVFTDLNRAAPDLSRFLRAQAPFARAATPAVKTLGEATVPGTPAVKALLPIAQQLETFGKTARPVTTNIADILESFQKSGGIERLMDYIFYQVAAINGFDSFGHYLRAGLIVNLCSTYAVAPGVGCSSNFAKSSSRATSAAKVDRQDPVLDRTDQVLRGADPKDVLAGAQPTSTPVAARSRPPIAIPRVALPGRRPTARRRGTRRPTAAAASGDPRAGLFDYLFGKETGG